jgi:uncharacterized protein YraI
VSRVIAQPKFAGETVLFNVDFSDRMGTGETITTPTATVTVYSGVDASPPAFTAAASGQTINVTQTGGVVGVTYSVLVQAQTSAGQVLQKSYYLTVIPVLT